MSFEYNFDGIRKSKTYGNTTVNYITDGSKIIAENRNGTYIYYVYDEKGAIMGMMYGGQMYTYRKNLQGDVTGIYTASGTLVAKYQYSPYGEILAITDGNGNNISANASHIANVNPFRYRGYYYDTETGFYYLQSRYYDPVVGRFLNADAILGANGGIVGYNSFAYCNNNPKMFSDSSGYLRNYNVMITDGGGSTVDKEEYQKNESLSCTIGTTTQYEGATDDRYYGDALHDSHRFGSYSPFRERFLWFEGVKPSIDLYENGYVGGSIGGDLLKGGWYFDNAEIELFEFFHAEAGAIAGDQFSFGAEASVWSPSISFNIFGINVGLGFEVVSAGAGLDFEIFDGGFSVALNGIADISISKKG